MPYMKKKNGEKWCVYKKSEDGGPEGDTFGCHDTEEQADAQIAAIYASENKRGIAELWEKVKGLFAPHLPAPEPERAADVRDVYWQIMDALDSYGDDSGHRPIFHGLYTDNARLFAAAILEGVLYRIPVTVDGEGRASMGEWERVIETRQAEGGEAVGRSTISIIRQADGRIRWLALACSAVLNRVGEIDSMTLFDNMVRHARELNRYPYLTFYHMGEAMRLGQADYLARDGALYINSGLFDDTPLARAAIAGLEADPGYWGTSIRYVQLSEPEMVEVVKGINLPVFRDGIQEEVSILAETRAAALLTAIGTAREVKSVNERVKADLVKLVGQDMADECEKRVDGANQRAMTEGMVVRTAEPEPEPASEAAAVETPAPEPAPVERQAEPEPAAEPTPEPAPAPNVVDTAALEAEVVARIAAQLPVNATIMGLIAPVTERQNAVDSALEGLGLRVDATAVAINALAGEIKALKAGIERLSQPVEERIANAVADMPRNSGNTVGYRPRTDAAADPEPVKPGGIDKAAADQAVSRLAQQRQKAAKR